VAVTTAIWHRRVVKILRCEVLSSFILCGFLSFFRTVEQSVEDIRGVASRRQTNAGQLALFFKALTKYL
jgi:hypothetical protein